ncbi:MAG: D-alanyl-D-alanine carboxypeptidase family protein [Solirubrobacterales bacterium]
MRRLLVAFLVLALLTPAAAWAEQPQAPATSPASTPPKLNAKAWIVIDPRDGAVLTAKGPDRRLPIASTTKLMTAYLALQQLKRGQKLRAPRYSASDAESLLGLRVGERMSVRDLLFALVLESANDAAETLAVGVAGSVPAFVDEMNAAAQKLGLADTHYSTPVGLDQPGNHSSAHDLVTLTALLLQDPLFAKASDSPAADLKTGDHPRHIVTRNLLLNSTPFVTGVKTGHTLDAGYVLVGSGEEHGTTLISAVLGTPSESARDADTLQLLKYGFAQYEPQTPVKKGEEVASPKLSYRGDHLELDAARSLPVSVRPGQRVATKVNAPAEVDGPVDEGQKLGSVTVSVDGRPAGKTPLVAAESVAAASLIQKATSTVFSPAILLLLGLIVIVVGVLLARRDGEDEPPAPRRTQRSATKEQRSAEERERMREERMRRRNRQESRTE